MSDRTSENYDPGLKRKGGGVLFAGTSTAETDDDSSVVITLTGAAATDIGIANLSAAANAVYVTKVVMSANTMTVTLSGNGGAGTTVDYLVVRPTN